MRRLLPSPAVLIALGVCVPVALAPLKIHDLFFHLAGARWFLAHGFPQRDPFSVTASSGWVPHEYGFGVVAELLSRVLGGAGISLFVSALVAGNVLLLWRALRLAAGARGLAAVLLLLLSLSVHSYTWPQERPYHAGHLFFAATMVLTLAWARGRRRILWCLPPLVALWANVHGSWLLGPLYLAAFAGGGVLAATTTIARRHAAEGLVIALVAFLAAGLSPMGLDVYLYPVKHASLPSTQLIEEWQPLRLSWGWARSLVLLMCVFLVSVWQARRRHLPTLIPAVGLAIGACAVQRHAPFAAMALLVSTCAHLRTAKPFAFAPVFRDAWRRIDRAVVRWSRAASGGVLIVATFVVLAIMAAHRPVSVRDSLIDGWYPMTAIDRLRTLPPGRVLNFNTLGGLVSFFAGPEYKVFIDTRNDPFPEPIHRAYETLWRLEPGWQDVVTGYAPDYILWRKGAPWEAFALALPELGGYEKIVDEPAGTLWVRSDARFNHGDAAPRTLPSPAYNGAVRPHADDRSPSASHE